MEVLLRGAKAEDLEEGLFLGGPGLLPPLPVELNNDTIVASLVQVSSALSRVRLVTPWTAACQVSLSITNSRSLLKLMSVESMMPSNHLILCHPLLLLPLVFPVSWSFQMSQLFTSGDQSIRVSASASVLPMNIQD